MGHVTEVVPLDLTKHLLGQIQTVPMAQFDAHLIEFLQKVTARGIEFLTTNDSDKDKEREKLEVDLEAAHWFGLPLLWHGLCQARFPAPLLSHVMQALCASLGLPPCYRLRQPYLVRCLDNIRARRLLGPSMQILQVLIGTHLLHYCQYLSHV